MEKALLTADQQGKKSEHRTDKELNKAINKLKRKKKPRTGRDTQWNIHIHQRDIQNNAQQDTWKRRNPRKPAARAHPETIQREGSQWKVLKRKRNNPSKQSRKIVRTNHLRKSKNTSPPNRGPSRRNPGKRYLWPPHNPGPNNPRNPWRQENSIHAIPWIQKAYDKAWQRSRN